jgi:hypothetical protein
MGARNEKTPLDGEALKCWLQDPVARRLKQRI